MQVDGHYCYESHPNTLTQSQEKSPITMKQVQYFVFMAFEVEQNP